MAVPEKTVVLQRLMPILAAVTLAVLLSGCPPPIDLPPVADGALREARAAVELRALREVVDGPGVPGSVPSASKAFEHFIERGPVSRVVEAVGYFPETWLRKKADDFAYDAFLDTPDASRGKLIFAYLIVGEIRDLPFRADGERLKLLIGGTPQGEFYACIYPARRGRGRLYGGDVVWCTGIFVKTFSFVDGGGKPRRVPLIAGPPPTYTKDWFPYRALLKELGLEAFFPVKVDLSPPPPYLFIDMDASGITTVGGYLLGRSELEHRLDGLVEASRIRRKKGVVLLRSVKGTPTAELETVKGLVAERGLLVIEKGEVQTWQR